MARKDGKDRGLVERPPDSGVWWVRIMEEGREHCFRVGSKTAARAFYERAKQEQREERFQPERHHARATKAIRLSAWIEQTKPPTGTTKSEANRRAYGTFWTAALNDPPLRRITPRAIEAIRASLIESGKMPATANRYTSYLRRLCSLAVRDGVLMASPFRQIKPLKEPPGPTRFLTDAEALVLLKALPATARPPVVLAMNTGLRREECLRLRWDSVDLDNRVVTVYKTKSGKARSVPLNAAALAALRSLNSWMTSPWVFPSDNPATPTDPDNFYNRIFLPACHRAGLDDVGFHTLRHTFASHLAMADTTLYAIQKLLGHANIRTTERYAHLAPSYLKEPVERLRLGTVIAQIEGKIEGVVELNRDLDRDQIPPQNHVPAQVIEKMVELRGIEPLTFRLPV